MTARRKGDPSWRGGHSSEVRRSHLARPLSPRGPGSWGPRGRTLRWLAVPGSAQPGHASSPKGRLRAASAQELRNRAPPYSARRLRRSRTDLGDSRPTPRPPATHRQCRPRSILAKARLPVPERVCSEAVVAPFPPPSSGTRRLRPGRTGAGLNCRFAVSTGLNPPDRIPVPQSWRYRLGVRTVGSQPSNRASNPRSATII